MKSSGCRLFLLDAQTTILIYLAAPLPSSDIDFDFPPERDSAIWRHVGQIKQQQINTPTVLVGRAGSEEGDLFEAHLLEEGCTGEQEKGKFSFDKFLQFHAREVERYLQASGLSLDP